MINSHIRKIIKDHYDNAVFFESPAFDNSIIGIAHNGSVIYSMRLMVDELMETDDITDIEAYEYIQYNTLGALPDNAGYPVVMVSEF